MSKDILGMYGKDSGAKQGGRASNGGQMQKKELPYCPPVGPKGQGNNSPGLGGTNHGNKVCQGKH